MGSSILKDRVTERLDVAGARFGIDVPRVQEALRAQQQTAVPLAPPGIAGLVNLRGQVVMRMDLRTLLGLEPLAADAKPMMVIVEVHGELISLLVDEIGDVGDVVDVEDAQFESSPDTLPPALRGIILGAYKLEQGLRLALDIDRATAA